MAARRTTGRRDWRPPARRFARHATDRLRGRRRGPRSEAALPLTILATILAGVAACSPAPPAGPAPATDGGASSASGPRVAATSTLPAGGGAGTADAGPMAALALRDVAALAAPGGKVTAHFPARQPWGDPTAFLVRDHKLDASGVGWYQVSLPRRPNGSTGWLRADHVRVEHRPRRVEVDLSARSLRLLDGGRVVREASVAIGAAATPTPKGRYYITAELRPPRISSFFGPWALALSAYSDVLEQFGTGDGQIAIHGTANTAELGRAITHGCVRVDNRTVTELARLLQPGTPVTITA
jgi:lipoprotein-anchoring transpeptidase ErfK/SrfK